MEREQDGAARALHWNECVPNSHQAKTINLGTNNVRVILFARIMEAPSRGSRYEILSKAVPISSNNSLFPHAHCASHKTVCPTLSNSSLD